MLHVGVQCYRGEKKTDIRVVHDGLHLAVEWFALVRVHSKSISQYQTPSPVGGCGILLLTEHGTHRLYVIVVFISSKYYCQYFMFISAVGQRCWIIKRWIWGEIINTHLCRRCWLVHVGQSTEIRKWVKKMTELELVLSNHMVWHGLVTVTQMMFFTVVMLNSWIRSHESQKHTHTHSIPWDHSVTVCYRQTACNSWTHWIKKFLVIGGNSWKVPQQRSNSIWSGGRLYYTSTFRCHTDFIPDRSCCDVPVKKNILRM